MASTAFNWTATESGITIEYCIEVCRGMDRPLALLHMESCFCEFNLNNYDMTMAMDCNSVCDGNPYQECGGEIRGALSVYDVGPANACE